VTDDLNSGETRIRGTADELIAARPASYEKDAADDTGGPVYALNLFDLADRDEYLAYSRRSAREVAAHGGRVVALGRFREAVSGEIEPRQVMILVEWRSRAAFESYLGDPRLADLHPHREKGASSYVWHLFDRLDDLRSLLRPGTGRD
jgi:uncharacterized protein (DUF1330 family)